MIDLPGPVHWDNAVVIDPNGNARRPVGQPPALRRMAASKDVSDLLFQAHFRQDHLRENLGKPLSGSHAIGPAGLLEEVPVSQNYAQVFVQQQN